VTRTRRQLALLLMVWAAAVGLSVSSASAGTLAVSPRDSKSKLAIKQVSDSMNGQYVTYRVETYDGWNNVKDFSIIRWYFDLKKSGHYSDMCILLEGVGDGRLRAEFYPKCGPVAWSTAEARKPAANVVEFDLLVRDLIKGAGVVPGQPLRYRVYSEDFFGGHDWAPTQVTGFIEEAPLPHLSEAELAGGYVPNELGAAGKSTEASPVTAPTSPAHNSSPFGSLPIASVLLGTLIIVAILWVLWRLLARRLWSTERTSSGVSDQPSSAESGDGDAVHSRDAKRSR